MSRSKLKLRKQIITATPVTKIDEIGSSRNNILRALCFLLLFIFLQALYGSLHDTWIENLVIDQATVKTSAWLISVFDADVGVRPMGSRLNAPGGGINVLNGCEGTDIIFLMISAMLVAPISLKNRIIGLLLGVILVFVMNQGRIIALFYAFRSDKVLFGMLHGVITPLVLVTMTGVYFIFWLYRNTKPEDEANL